MITLRRMAADRLDWSTIERRFALLSATTKRYPESRSQIMIGGFMSDNISGLCSEMSCVETDEPPSSTLDSLLNL